MTKGDLWPKFYNNIFIKVIILKKCLLMLIMFF